MNSLAPNCSQKCSSCRRSVHRSLQAVIHRPSTLARAGRNVACGSLGSDIGSDITQSFIDLTSLVAADKAKKGTFDDLAYAIGRDVYADLNGWHLFLKDMATVPGGPRMSTVLAEQLGTQILTDGFDEQNVEAFLKKVPVKLGGGKACVSLDAVIPTMGMSDIVRACEEFSRDV